MSRRSSVEKIAIPLTATALGFFLLGYGGIVLAGGHNHSSVIWPATAFAICMLLRWSRTPSRDAAFLGTIFIAGLVANGLSGAPPAHNLAFTIISLVEIYSAVWATRHFAFPRFRSFRSVLRIALVGGIAPALLGALLAAGASAMMGNGDWLGDGFHWFCGNFLAFCMIFPLGMTVSLRQLAKLRLAERPLELVIVIATVLTTSLLAFRFSPYPLHFLVLASVLLATVRFRFIGAGAALLVICAIALFSPDSFSTHSPIVRIEILQAFLAICSILSVRAAVVLNERDLHLAINESRRIRAVRVSRFKSELLSHVSHEVRSPLSAIIGFSNMLESGTLPAASARDFAHVIGHNGELLQRLHDDLLDLARAEAGQLAIRAERVAVTETLRICIGGLRLDASLGGKDVLLEEQEDGILVTADPARLAQIVNNLIANAFKYGDSLSPVRVRTCRLDDGFARIEVVNAGPGIPARERDSVFQPFIRGAEVGRRVPGAGLGLSIAKLLVERQGGRIDFESVPGRQTRFWVDLPLAA